MSKGVKADRCGHFLDVHKLYCVTSTSRFAYWIFFLKTTLHEDFGCSFKVCSNDFQLSFLEFSVTTGVVPYLTVRSSSKLSNRAFPYFVVSRSLHQISCIFI
jgi:hypothetical protein